MISLENVDKVYGDRLAVEGVSLTINKGDRAVLLGASGSGKTTLLRMINRLLEPSSGSIFIDGENIKHSPAYKLRLTMGFVLQANSLFPHYTVEDNISITPRLLKWDEQRVHRRVYELMDKLHLPRHYAKKFPGELSGGEAQRVNLARALAVNPPILLMDEPFSALDNITRVSVRKMFLELEELSNTTIVMVTHDIREAFELGDFIAILKNGKLLQCGEPVDLLSDPADDYVRDFLSNDYINLLLFATNVETVWTSLVDEPYRFVDTTIMITSKESIGRVIEMIRDKLDVPTVCVMHGTTGEKKNISWQQLLGAWIRRQNIKDHEQVV